MRCQGSSPRDPLPASEAAAGRGEEWGRRAPAALPCPVMLHEVRWEGARQVTDVFPTRTRSRSRGGSASLRGAQEPLPAMLPAPHTSQCVLAPNSCLPGMRHVRGGEWPKPHGSRGCGLMLLGDPGPCPQVDVPAAGAGLQLCHTLTCRVSYEKESKLQLQVLWAEFPTE